MDQVKAPIDNISTQDRLDDPNNLDMLERIIYQVHEYLSGGLHYSSYQEKWILKQLVPDWQLDGNKAIQAQVGRN